MSSQCRTVATLVALLAAWPSGAAAQSQAQFESSRKTTTEQLSIAVQRAKTANGLTVLLSPDPTVSSVVVWMSFRAGTLFEPAGKSGLAHLTEHVLATGPTPDTDYSAILESRGAYHFNALTGLDSLRFEVALPAQELPAALWACADRLGTLVGQVDDALVARHRQVVEQERLLRVADEPYGDFHSTVFGRLFPEPHPLHAGVIGTPAELATVTAADLKAFASAYLVPANAILTVVGNFDPATALRLVDEGLARLPSGQPAQLPPALPGPVTTAVQVRERLSRHPRVALAWRFPNLLPDHAPALALGAQLLTFFLDGAWGMSLDTSFIEYTGEAMFRMDLELPYEESVAVAQDDADGFLRMLTLREMPLDFVMRAHLILDRSVLFALDTLGGRSAILTYVERQSGKAEEAGRFLERHWFVENDVVRDVARIYLRRPHAVVHARPVRPRAAKVERREEEVDPE
ncbi:MAG: pitrilysin family protein [Myxococcales bacterium]